MALRLGMDNTVPVRCVCARLVDDLMHGTVADLGATALLIADGSRTDPRFFRCAACATIWQEQWFPAMHVDVQIMSRTRLDPAGAPVPVFYNLPGSGLRRL